MGVYACASLINPTGNERRGLCGVPHIDISASQSAIGSRVRFPQGSVVATLISNGVCTGHGLGEVSVLELKFVACTCVCME